MPDDALTPERVQHLIAFAMVAVGELAKREQDGGRHLHHEVAMDALVGLRDMQTALIIDPARWCGVVGVVSTEWRKELSVPYSGAQSTGRLIVTPHAKE